jgi:hypothetical protein
VSRRPAGLSFERLPIALLFLVSAGIAALSPAQNDTFWHLRAGADIWRTGSVPRLDHYSFTAAGSPWPDHEWLSQALMYGAYRAGGMPLLELAATAVILAGLILVYRLMVGPLRTRFVLLALALPALTLVWTLRPQLLTLLCLMVLAWLLVRERYWFIPLLFLVWANAHAGVMLGGFVLLATAAAAVARWRLVRGLEDRRRLAVLGAVLPLSALATSATPMGFGIFGFVIESLRRSSLVPITEWFPASPTDLVGILFWPLAAAFVAMVVVRRRALAAGSWGDWAVVAAALALAPLAFRSARNIGPFLMLAVPAASRLLGSDFVFRLRRRPAAPDLDRPMVNLALVVGLGVTLLAVVAVAWATGLRVLGWRPLSDGAIAATRSCKGPLYNQYDEGGYLIWFVPEKPVFVDGRQDPYPVSLLLDQLALERGQTSHEPLFDRWKIRCAFLPARSPTVRALISAGWTVPYRDPDWVVLAKAGT